ncbi:MAG: M23 family metallopeptidase [Pyrinomonadaceae bacterium]|nr:M23 family metallopeptidase [Pyrinomonadaceae bacterium]
MRKNNSFYTFLLTHTTKEKIYIRRVEVSKRVLHSSVVSAFLLLSLGFTGIFAASKTDAFNTLAMAAAADSAATVGAENKESNVIAVSGVEESNKPLNYARPVSTDLLAGNSGGPTSGSYQLTAASSDKEESAIEKKLRQIEAEANPRYLPTIWAHLGKINNEFGFRRNPFGGRSYEFHSGMDIDGEKGDLIVAPANGRILKAGWQGGYGYLIEIDHGNGLTTRYGHLSKLGVKEGDIVQRGQLIGLIGSTGRSTGPHLHYELRLDEKAINPRRFLPPEPSALG